MKSDVEFRVLLLESTLREIAKWADSYPEVLRALMNDKREADSINCVIKAIGAIAKSALE